MKMSYNEENAYEEVNMPPVAKEEIDVKENKCYGTSNALGQKKTNKKTVIMVLVVLLVFAAVAACCIAFTLEILKLKSNTFSPEQEQSLATTADTLHSLNTSINGLLQRVITFESRIQQLNTSLDQQVSA